MDKRARRHARDRAGRCRRQSRPGVDSAPGRGQRCACPGPSQLRAAAPGDGVDPRSDRGRASGASTRSREYSAQSASGSHNASGPAAPAAFLLEQGRARAPDGAPCRGPLRLRRLGQFAGRPRRCRWSRRPSRPGERRDRRRRPTRQLIAGWWAETFGVGSALAAPIGRRTDVVGVIALDSPAAGAFAESDGHLLADAAARLGGIVELARGDGGANDPIFRPPPRSGACSRRDRVHTSIEEAAEALAKVSARRSRHRARQRLPCRRGRPHRLRRGRCPGRLPGNRERAPGRLVGTGVPALAPPDAPA